VATVPPPLKEPPKPKPEKTRKARAREDERVKPEEINPEPVEIRGGLSDSTALNSNLATGPSVAQGNSAEVGVDPSKGDLPPPAPVPVGTNSDVVDYAAIAVEEAFASSSADCAGALPELELSDDAVNAGLTSGQLIIEVIVDDKGIVRQPKLIKGTGYQIDAIALKEVQKMKCNPAQENGKSTVVRKELRFEVVDY
jgi:outer membrane biosynthesis protein TonB